MTHAEQIRHFVEICQESMPTSILDAYEEQFEDLLTIADELEA